jgi:hypothetical protein
MNFEDFNDSDDLGDLDNLSNYDGGFDYSKNEDSIAYSNFLKDFDTKLEESKKEALEKLGNKYFIVSLSDYNKYIDLMTKENISIDKGIFDGFEENELLQLFDKCVEIGLTIFFIQFTLMQDFIDKKNLLRLYTYEPIKEIKELVY